MNRIERARILAGFESANQAARTLGLDQSQYNKIENAAEPSLSGKMALRLAEGFGFTTDQILGRTELPELPVTATPAAS